MKVHELIVRVSDGEVQDSQHFSAAVDYIMLISTVLLKKHGTGQPSYGNASDHRARAPGPES